MRVNKISGTSGKPNVSHILEWPNNYNGKKPQRKEIVLLLLHSHDFCVYFSPTDARTSDLNSEKQIKLLFYIFQFAFLQIMLSPFPLVKAS